MTFLWRFDGLLPEEGDTYLVWASSAEEALSQGRQVAGYEDVVYEDMSFVVGEATVKDILLLSGDLVESDPDFLDTPEVRAYLTGKVKEA